MKALRAVVGLPQRAIAAQTGISESRYWRLENGYDEPTERELSKLARVLKVTVSDLPFVAMEQAS